MRLAVAFWIALLVLAVPARAQWTPPIGIPSPTFGPNAAQPSPPASWSANPSSVTAGYYYVCRTCAGATDSGNTYGHPGQPRLTVPTTLAAGSYVEVRGTGYTLGSTTTWQMSGTSGSPIWVVGIGNPDFTGTSGLRAELDLAGDYWAVKGFRFINTRLRTGNGSTNVGAQFTVLRDNELTGWTDTRTTNMIGFYGSPTNRPHDQVFYNNYVHHNGPYTDAGGDIDQHGIGVGGYSYNVWVVDNTFEHNSGDGIQINSSNGACCTGDPNNTQIAHHIYVGRNTFIANWQTGFWTKDARDVIFSENTSRDHQVTTYAPGACGGGQYGPQYVWYLYNTCYNNHDGLRIQSDSLLHGTNIYFIGNLIYNNRQPSPSASPDGDAHGAIVTRDIDNRYIINNTIWGNDGGIHCNNSPITTLVVVNNIVGANAVANDADILCDATPGSATITNNVLQNNRIRYNHAAETLAQFQARTGLGASSTTATPLFVNVAASNYQLQLTDTAAKNQGVVNSVYNDFLTRYGISIAVDKNHLARPQGGVWDMGAFEVQETLSLPSAPSNLRIVN